MTKKKSIWAFVLALCLIMPTMFMLTACGKDKGGETTHTHTYSEEWEKDPTYHWHTATCEHTDEKGAYGEHTFGDWTVKTPATTHHSAVENAHALNVDLKKQD